MSLKCVAVSETRMGETLPPGEGRGGTAAMLKSKPKGRGITRPAQSRRRRKDGDTALGAVFQGCGGGPAVPVLLSFFLGSAAAYRACANRVLRPSDRNASGCGPFGQGGWAGTLRAEAGLAAGA
jgi:hypothetical protein